MSKESGVGHTGPPDAICRKRVKVAVGTVVEAGTQELERPFINTVVVGDFAKKGIVFIENVI